MAINEDEFYAEKARYQAETEAANQQRAKLEHQTKTLIINNALHSAFVESGGKVASPGDGGDSPFDLISAYLSRRIELDKNNQVVIKNQYGNIETNNDGTPKSIQQKMQEIKQGTLRTLFVSAKDATQSHAVNDSLQKFEASGKPQQQTQTGRKTYTREQARKGKADIDAIARGRQISSSANVVLTDYPCRTVGIWESCFF